MLRTFYTLSLALAVTSLAFAQSPVTFAVDMNDVDEFDPAADVLRVAGNFQGWNPTDATNANILTDPDGNGVYAVTMDVMDGEINFKYVINNWDGSDPDGANEFSGTTPGTPGACTNSDGNRLEVISGPTDLPVYVYNSCDVSTLVISSVRTPRALADMNVAPNPAHATTVLRLPALDGATAELRLVNTLGQEVRRFAPTRSVATELDVTGLAQGFYLLVVETGSNGVATRRLTIR